MPIWGTKRDRTLSNISSSGTFCLRRRENPFRDDVGEEPKTHQRIGKSLEPIRFKMPEKTSRKKNASKARQDRNKGPEYKRSKTPAHKKEKKKASWYRGGNEGRRAKLWCG